MHGEFGVLHCRADFVGGGDFGPAAGVSGGAEGQVCRARDAADFGRGADRGGADGVDVRLRAGRGGAGYPDAEQDAGGGVAAVGGNDERRDRG